VLDLTEPELRRAAGFREIEGYDLGGIDPGEAGEGLPEEVVRGAEAGAVAARRQEPAEGQVGHNVILIPVASLLCSKCSAFAGHSASPIESF